MRTRRYAIVVTCGVCGVLGAGSALAQGAASAGNGVDAPKGIVDLTTSYGDSGTVASVVGVSGTTDTIEVTFAEEMNPGTFGMGLNFATTWTTTWNADNTVLTIGGDLDFSAAADPALVLSLLQTDAARKDIAEPNVFVFQDIDVTGATMKNSRGHLDLDVLSPNGTGYSVYIAHSEDGPFERHDKVNFTSQGAYLLGLERGETYWAYVEYLADGLAPTRTAPVALVPFR